MHQGVEPVGGHVGRGVEAHPGVVGFNEDELLAPVAEDIAPEGGAAAVGLGDAVGSEVAVDRPDAVGDAGGLVEFLDGWIEGAGAGAVDEFAQQIGVPPKALGGPDVVGVDLRALGVVDAGLGGIHLVALVGGVEVEGDAAADVHDIGGIPFFDHLAGAGLVVGGGEEAGVVLLDDEVFETGAVRIDVGDMETIAVGDLGDVEELGAVVVDDMADIDDLVLAVIVDVGDADLVSLGAVESLRGGPALGELAVAVIEGGESAIEGAGAVAVVAVEQDARALAVEVADGALAGQGAELSPGVGQGGAGELGPGEAVDDGDKLGGVACGADGGDDLSGGVGDADAVGGAHGDLGFAVAVEVVDGDVVGVAHADGRGAGFVGVLVN